MKERTYGISLQLQSMGCPVPSALLKQQTSADPCSLLPEPHEAVRSKLHGEYSPMLSTSGQLHMHGRGSFMESISFER